MKIADLVQAQPPPATSGAGPAVWPVVEHDTLAGVYRGLDAFGYAVRVQLADLMKERDLHGRTKYGVPLQVQNGRDPLIDLIQEFLDACAYTRQAYEEALADYRYRTNPVQRSDLDELWKLHEASVVLAARSLEFLLRLQKKREAFASKKAPSK